MSTILPLSEEQLLTLRNDILPYKEYTEYSPMPASGVEVSYCSICGLPQDFCEFGPSWDKCRSSAVAAYPQLYPQYQGEGDEKDADQHQGDANSRIVDDSKNVDGDISSLVTIRKLIRSKRKIITSVSGLESYGVDIQQACKLFAKKFACGCGVVKSTGSSEAIEIQGDVEEDLFDYILDTWGDKISDDAITFGNESTKKGRSRKGGNRGRKGATMKRSGAALAD